MNHTEVINEVARRLYKWSRRDVTEVVDTLLEIWRNELQQPDGSVHIRGLGRLYVQQQRIHSTGAVRQTMIAKHGAAAPQILYRFYFRFSPSDNLKQAVMQARKGEKSDE